MNKQVLVNKKPCLTCAFWVVRVSLKFSHPKRVIFFKSQVTHKRLMFIHMWQLVIGTQLIYNDSWMSSTKPNALFINV